MSYNTICHVKDPGSLFKITDMDCNEMKLNFKIKKLKFINELKKKLRKECEPCMTI